MEKAGLKDVEKVMLGKAYRVGKWLMDGYLALVKRQATISDEEVNALGNHIAIQLFRLREKAWKPPRRMAGALSDNQIKNQVHDNFETELSEAGYPKREVVMKTKWKPSLLMTLDSDSESG